MGTWHAYIDESYNTKTFCVGGFLAPEGIWNGIVHDWSERIECERRRSVKKGVQPISRYHATDCASLKKEFDKKHGWNVTRQINLTKRLCEILGKHLPTGIVVGGGLDDIQRYLPPDPEQARAFLYSTCFKMCLLNIAGLMREHVYDGRVRIFYERGEYDYFAQEAFEMLKRDNPSLFGCLVSAEPKGWEDCIPLQTADFIAYQGFQRVNSSLNGSAAVRKSLQALVDKDIPISISHFQDQNFADIMKMIENRKAGRPINEGIYSSLNTCVGDFLPYIPVE
jgi:hypothetical protein